jgi:7-cyano-7-deazaguanine synthase
MIGRPQGHRSGRQSRRPVLGVLASGGLDSCALLAELALRRRVVPIYIRQGLAWEPVELYWLRRFLRAVSRRNVAPLAILSLPMGDLYRRHWSLGKAPVPSSLTPDAAVYLPGRNLVLVVKAAVFAALRGIPALALGSLGHNPFPDARPAFFRRWGAVLSQGLGTRLRLVTPYRHLSKARVIRRARAWPLALTFSCLSPRGLRHCGRCNKCAERRSAFEEAGLRDATSYAHRSTFGRLP